MSSPARAAPPPDTRRSPGDVGDVYRELAPTVARWVRRLGGATIDVDDVVQEVFAHVVRLWPRFDGRAKPSTWIFTITAREVRRRQRQARLRGFLFRTKIAAAPHETAPTPHDHVESARRRATLDAILAEMPARHREAFVLFELEGLSGEQIAEMLSCKPSNVWLRVHRARADFKKRLARVMDARKGASL